MNSIKAFFKEKGRYLFCLALVFAATVAGVLALRAIVDGLRGLGTAPGAGQEAAPWNEESEQNTTVNNPAEDVPKPTAQPGQSGSAASSAPPSSSGAASESGKNSGAGGGLAGSSGQGRTSPASPWAAKPVQAFSGDELVYQETLGDWRTHNGADYAAPAGAEVPPAVPGTVTAVYHDALWGGVVEVAAQNGSLWKYCGLENTRVKQDDKITTDTVLGTVGTIPAEQAQGSHLHLEYTEESVYKDPEKAKR